MSSKQFDFGKNWTEFSTTSLSAERIDKAREDFAKLTATIRKDHRKQSFIDIGFGQGLSLLIASEHFSHVVGCDINPKCADALRLTQAHFHSVGTSPTVAIGSILDNAFTESIISENRGKFDVVHSWGVLHHTGDMWRAIETAAGMVERDGYFILAIYNRHWTSHIWKVIKYGYVHAPRIIQQLMVWSLFWIKKLTGYEKGSDYRGMDFYYDIVDWVGGYPYEFASKDEIDNKMHDLGFQFVEWFPTDGFTGCNEFVYKRKS